MKTRIKRKRRKLLDLPNVDRDILQGVALAALVEERDKLSAALWRAMRPRKCECGRLLS